MIYRTHKTALLEGSNKLNQAVAWFKANGVESTLRACAENTGVSMGTARHAREALKNAGVLDPNFSPKNPVAGRRPLEASTLDPLHTRSALPPPPAVPRPATLLREGQATHMTPDEARGELSKLARGANSDQAQLAALKAIISEGETSGSTLGPGPPLTRDDRLHRASLIMQAVGRTDAPEVWRRAFNEAVDVTTQLPPPVIVDDIPAAPLPLIETQAAPLPGAPAIVIEVSNAPV